MPTSIGRALRLPFSLPVLLASSLLCMYPGNLVHAQQQSVSATPPRIAQAVDESKTVKLTGNVPMLARPEFDQGELSSSTQLTHVRIILSRSKEQEAALDRYLAQLQDKSSPNFHKWLTPDQFGKLYGPADSDVAAVVAWLESHGFKLEQVSTGRTTIAFSATAGQIEEAFHTKIHNFDARGEKFYSNTSDPAIPAALAPVVSGVANLNSIHPKSFHEAGPTGAINRSSKRVLPIDAVQAKGPRPNLTSGNGSTQPYFLYIVPGDAATMYDTPNSFNANFSTGTSYNGSGVTIGIGGAAAIQTSTVLNYRNNFLGDSNTPTITNVDGVGANGDTDEAYIDVELSGGMAPGANIHFYTSSDLFSALNQAVADNTVDILSVSFGACELELTTAGNTEINQLWQQANAQGIAITVSTGDNGSALCDAFDGSGTTEALYGLGVNGYASTPYDIAVGGLDTAGLLTSFSTYVSTSSQGSASTFYRTALNYIPEATWNDSTTTDTTISADVPWTVASGNANIAGGSGGFSNCAVNTDPGTTQTPQGTCTSGYPKPAWQRGAGVPSDGARDLPDVSLMAGNGFDSATWAVCTDDPVSGQPFTTNCDSNGYINGFGGTSTAAPAFAGILALVQQKTGGRLGQAAVELYDLFNGSNAASVFHDTTVGNNSVPCAQSTPSCTLDAAGNYFESGYDTTTGYDLATGIGSVDATKLIASWGSGVGITADTVAAVPSSKSITNAQSDTIAVTITGTYTGPVTGTGATVPTGTVTITSGSYNSGPQPITTGANESKATVNIPAGSLAVGANTLTVNYSGDENFATASATTSVSVVPPVTLSPTTLAFPNTGVAVASSPMTVTVTNTGTTALTFTGVSITGTNAGSFSETNTCTSVAVSATCTVAVTFTPAAFGALTGTLSIVDSAGTQTVSLTGTGIEVGSYTLTASPLSLTAGQNGTSTITAMGIGGYDGSPITISSCMLATSPSGAVGAPSCSIALSPITVTNGTGTGTVTITTSAAVAGQFKPIVKKQARPVGKWIAGGGFAAALFLLFGIPAKRRKLLSTLGALLLVASFGVFYGCGGGGGGTVKNEPPPTVVTTTPASSVTTNSATIAGTVNPNGTSTTASFVYGTSSALTGGTTTTSQSAGSGSTASSISANLTSLTAGTKYYYEIQASNTGGSATGSIESFTTGTPATTSGTYTFTITGTDAAGVVQTATLTVTVS